MGRDAALTGSGRIGFEEAHEQGQRFSYLVDTYGPHVDGTMRTEFGGTGLEGPNVLDLIGTHQGGGGLVDVGLDL